MTNDNFRDGEYRVNLIVSRRYRWNILRSEFYLITEEREKIIENWTFRLKKIMPKEAYR